MPEAETYAVTLPGEPGSHAPPRVVVVHRTDRTGPAGHPVYVDDSGEFAMQISAAGIAELLTGAEQVGTPPDQPLTAHPVSSGRGTPDRSG